MKLSKLALLTLPILLMQAGAGAQTTDRAKLTASDQTTTDWFGRTIAIAGDTVVVGAPRADLPGQPVAGAV